VVRGYEKTQNADRLPVITLLENRIAKLALEGGEPSPGGPLPVTPEARRSGQGHRPGEDACQADDEKVRTT